MMHISGLLAVIFYFHKNVIASPCTVTISPIGLLDNTTISEFPFLQEFKDYIISHSANQLKPSKRSLHFHEFRQALHPFSLPSSLIYIFNYEFVDLPNLEYPVMLASPIQGLISFRQVKSSGYVYERTKATWLPRNAKRTNVSLESLDYDSRLDCLTSNFYFGGHANALSTDHCLVLNILEYSIFAKPWQYFIALNIHPMINEIYRKLPITYSYRVWEHYEGLPQITVLFGENDEKNVLWHSYVWRWAGDKLPSSMSDIISAQQTILSNEIFVAIAVNCTGNIIKVAILRPANVKPTPFAPVYIHFEKWVISSINLLVNYLAWPQTNEMIVWKGLIVRSDKMDDGLWVQLSVCGNRYAKSKTLVVSKYRDGDDQIQHAYAHELQTVMGNYSYRISKFKKCVNGKIEKLTSSDGLPLSENPILMWGTSVVLTYADDAHLAYQNVINASFRNLKFVSCKQRGTSQFPFSELHNIFDVYIWICVVVSMILLALAFAQIAKMEKKENNASVTDYMVSVAKVFLEQGDPFPAFIWKHVSLKWIGASCLLICIVLSNAYKNVNSYNMIIPRQPLLYQQLTELINDNFTVYTRTAFVMELQQYKMKTWFSLQIGFDRNLHILQPRIALSEIYKTKRKLEESMENTSLIEMVMNNSRLHPKINKVFKDLWDPIMSLWKVDEYQNWLYDLMLEISNLLRTRFWEKETRLLFESVSKCEKTAVILPQYKCNEFAKSLIRSGKNFTNIGEETFTKTFLVIELNGLAPPFLLWRMKGLMASGVMQWWQQFLVGKMDIKIPNILKVPSMSGNILVIFSVLLLGWAIAILTILVEVDGGNYSFNFVSFYLMRLKVNVFN